MTVGENIEIKAIAKALREAFADVRHGGRRERVAIRCAEFLEEMANR